MASSSTPNAPPARQAKQQYALRSQKQLGLVNGTPSYDPVEGFEKPDIATRTYQYSPDGKLLAYVLPNCVQILQAETAKPVLELPVANVIEINFSPRATFLATWERPVKLEDGAQHKNLRVWSVASGEEVVSFSEKKQEGWDLQYTTSESHAIRMAGPEIQVYNPADWSKGVVDKLRVEGATSASLSPGQNPNVAVFIAEKKGAPASVQIFGLRTLAAAPTCRKSFFKADRCTIKWNRTGTQVLVLTQTDVDNSNKSYYGETMLYLLSSAGNFDCRVALDKEGPVHDFTWSPNSKEFGVVYGYTPAKAVLFDQRVKTLHDFGSHPINFISFNPQGRLVLLAGFGNLAGKCDIYDRRTLNKVASIDAPNTTFCQWSECGTFILTATLSPRLRVDNGVKIWHCTGALVHTQLVEELYQASWRPTLPEAAPPFPRDIPAAPAPSPSVQSTPVKAPATKPAGAYRPPGAQGRAAPSIFKREDEGGAAYVANNGSATPPRGAPFGTRTPTPVNPNAQNGRGGARRHVPGAAPQPESGPAEKEKKPRKKKGKGEERPRTANPSPREEKPEGAVNGLLHVPAAGSLHLSITSTNPENAGLQSPVGEGSLDPIAKKIRNLNKKLKAIEELKEKAKRGERLETTQLRKMEGEAEIRKELAAVMSSASGAQA